MIYRNSCSKDIPEAVEMHYYRSCSRSPGNYTSFGQRSLIMKRRVYLWTMTDCSTKGSYIVILDWKLLQCFLFIATHKPPKLYRWWFSVGWFHIVVPIKERIPKAAQNFTICLTNLLDNSGKARFGWRAKCYISSKKAGNQAKIQTWNPLLQSQILHPLCQKATVSRICECEWRKFWSVFADALV